MSTPILRNYQKKLTDAVRAAWTQGARAVLAVAPTGAGKTVCVASIVAEHHGAVLVMAHRQELVGQLAAAITPRDDVTIAGVDTLLRRPHMCDGVTLWVTDEAHHLLPHNKWGRVVARMPSALGLGVTATPLRADGAPLSGVFQTLVVGPTMRALIDQGWLSDYRVFAPPVVDLDLAAVPVTAAGDYSPAQLRTTVRRSRIVGDVVEHYTRHAAGCRGVTFATDRDTAHDLAARYTEAGTPAAVVTYRTPAAERIAAVQALRCGELTQLVNVDLFGEGFDLPAVEVVSMARPTMSYGLYVQQFGRALRTAPGKPHALILDHAGNVARHGLPDTGRAWSLDGRHRPNATERTAPLVSVCTTCTAVYLRHLLACPYCGAARVYETRNTPAAVGGDLTELTPDALAALRGQGDLVMMSDEDYALRQQRRGALPLWVMRHVKTHRAQRAACTDAYAAALRWINNSGLPQREAMREFWHQFGVDPLTVRTLPTHEARRLEEVIKCNS